MIFIALLFCHFLADYTHLSTSWMLNAKRLGTPLFPIFCHALVHTVLIWTLLAAIFGFTHVVMYAAIFELITHFLIDVWKGKMTAWFPSLQSPANKWHWIVFGFDQFLHVVVLFIIYQNVIR